MVEQRNPGLNGVTDWLLLRSADPLQGVVPVVDIVALEEKVIT